jgi:GT2 family glycosyltransferase
MSASYVSSDEPTAGGSNLITKSVVWSHKDSAGNASSSRAVSKIALEDLHLPPGWYRLKVWTSEEESVVAARARLLEDRRAELRIRMEPAGKRCFQKTFKIAEPLSSLSIALEGEPGASELCRIEVRPLGIFSVACFLGMKAARFAMSNKGRVSWRTSWTHLLAALHPRANFAFRGRYDRPGNESYDRWRAVHEHPNSAASSAKALAAYAEDRKLRIRLLIAEPLDSIAIKRQIEQSLIGSAVEISLADTRLLRRPDKLAAAAADFVLPIDRQGIFPPGAIERLVLKMAKNDDLAAVFADSDFLAPDGRRRDPRLKPPWDQELLWCTNYIRAPLMVRWAPDLAVALDLPGAALKPSYALALTLLARRERRNLGRVPAILFHETNLEDSEVEIDRRILSAHLQNLRGPDISTPAEGDIFKVDWPLPCPPPRVSIIIPSKDNAATLKICIDSIVEYTDNIQYEIIIADNGSSHETTKQYLKSLSGIENIKITYLPGPFNFSKINNDARKFAVGDVLVFLNDDTKIISRDWLVEMVSLAQRPEVGAVGALLLYPDGSVQHAGVLLGVGGPADHAFRYVSGDSGGYLDLLRCRREVTAVTGACLAVSAKHFDTVGGFDEKLLVTCNDVDLCLRLRAAGLINVWTPWSRLEHWESMSRGVDFTEAALSRQADELRIMAERWGDLMDRDPTYHPGLSDFAPNYCLSI